MEAVSQELNLSDSLFIVIVQPMRMLHAKDYANNDNCKKQYIYHLILALQRLTIPTGNAYHHSHTDYGFQKIVLLVFTYQSAGSSFERTVDDPNFLPNHGLGLALSHEHGGLEIRIAKHAELYHVAGRYLAKFFTTGISENTDWYRTLTKHLDHLLFRTDFLNEQQVMDSGNLNPLGMFRVGRIHPDRHGNKMGTFLFCKKTAHLLLLTIEGTDSIPRAMVRQLGILTVCFFHEFAASETMDCHLTYRYDFPSTRLHKDIL